MYQKKTTNELIACGMGITMEVIGGKWKPCLILSINEGLKRPSELHKAHPHASPRVLNQQLSELEDYGIVKKYVYPTLPPKVEYTLTAYGESLLPVLFAMEAWGEHFEKVFQPMHLNRQHKLSKVLL
jgi:DNA-binding HxlR family transcriptional regulator